MFAPKIVSIMSDCWKRECSQNIQCNIKAIFLLVVKAMQRKYQMNKIGKSRALQSIVS